MKNSEIIQLSDKELIERIGEEVALYAKMKLGHVITPVDNTYKITSARKNIARLKTEQRKRELILASNK
jgi:large subunit ribosomal protein L29